MTSFTVATDSCHKHSSSPLPAADLVQGAGYSESEMETEAANLKLETNAAAFELETDAAALELETNVVILHLETETDMSKEY
jgi:hypothetical protein